MDSAPSHPHNALVPAPKIENDFYDWHHRHEEKCQLVQGRKDFKVVCLGDSITHMFELAHQGCARGKRVWEGRMEPLGALNLGFGWDRTQNVLWRLHHGEFDGLKPLLAQVLIGTNNFSATANCPANNPEEIVGGIGAVVSKIHELSPKTAVLVLGVFPRDKRGSPMRTQIERLNDILKTACTGRPGVFYRDMGGIFLNENGEIPVEIMNDQTHPTEKGYQLWADAILPVWKELGV